MELLKNMLRLLKSLKFTVVIILCLIIVFLTGVIVPQESLLGRAEYLAWKTRNPGLVETLEFFGLTDIYTSFLTILLWILFFLNLIAVMTSRIPLIWKRVNSRIVFPDEELLSRGYVIKNTSLEDFIQRLKRKGYAVDITDERFFALKNRYSPLLTPLFHLSFILILAGGLVSFYTTFRAYADVATGETFQGDYRILKRPVIGDIPSPVFMVTSVRPFYYKGVIPTDLDIRIQDEEGEKIAGINRPYKKEGLDFVVKKIDIAPLFILLDKDGRELDGAFVKLNVLQGRWDSFEMGGYRFRISFFTDYGKEEPEDGPNLPQILKEPFLEKRAQTFEIRNPAMEVAVFKGSEFLSKKIIRPGEEIPFGDNRLLFSHFVYWVRFYAVGERGHVLIYSGFILLLLSLVLRFSFPRKEVSGLIRPDGLYVTGRVEFYGRISPEDFNRVSEVRP